MRIGLLADIHEDAQRLAKALEQLSMMSVDRLIALGDIAYTVKDVDATVALLAESNCSGVYGNHDLGLSADPDPELIGKLNHRSADFLRELNGNMVIEDCRFSHGAPWWDADDPITYYSEPWPHDADIFRANCEQFSERLFFTGHFHCWKVSSQIDTLDWNGDTPLHMPTGKHLVTIHAIKDGWCAIYDTDQATLLPVRCV